MKYIKDNISAYKQSVGHFSKVRSLSELLHKREQLKSIHQNLASVKPSGRYFFPIQSVIEF